VVQKIRLNIYNEKRGKCLPVQDEPHSSYKEADSTGLVAKQLQMFSAPHRLLQEQLCHASDQIALNGILMGMETPQRAIV
jgi:hypothetical protein